MEQGETITYRGTIHSVIETNNGITTFTVEFPGEICISGPQYLYHSGIVPLMLTGAFYAGNSRE